MDSDVYLSLRLTSVGTSDLTCPNLGFVSNISVPATNDFESNVKCRIAIFEVWV
jgi:hypothetical protein